jgi:hypothetical protein
LSGPLDVQDRARALRQIFPTRLSDNFLVDYDPTEFGEREGKLDSKKFFLELLLKYPSPEQQFETLCFWKEIFPGDVEWPEGNSVASQSTDRPGGHNTSRLRIRALAVTKSKKNFRS